MPARAASGRTSTWSWTRPARRFSCPGCTPPSRPSACRRPGSTPRSRKRPPIKGYTVVDAATVLATHLTEVLKTNMSELLSYAEVQKLLKDLPKEQGELVKDIVPSHDHRLGHPARAAAPARRARLDPRPADHPGRHRRRALVHAQPELPGRARAHAARAPDLRPAHLAERLPAAHRAVGEVGAGVRRVDRRPGRGEEPRDGALAALRVHHC